MNKMKPDRVMPRTDCTLKICMFLDNGTAGISTTNRVLR